MARINSQYIKQQTDERHFLRFSCLVIFFETFTHTQHNSGYAEKRTRSETMRSKKFLDVTLHRSQAIEHKQVTSLPADLVVQKIEHVTSKLNKLI